MIQFNLLPDVKLEYIRAEQTKRLVMVISILITAVSLLIMVALCLVVLVFQKKYMNDLSTDIKTYSRNLSNTGDINKILTVQNQLNSLTTLHQSKPDTTRLLPFLEQMTPSDISISTLNIDFEQQTIDINGSTKTDSTNPVASVNKFVDTIKFTNYVSGGTKTKAFSAVVLTNLGRTDKVASYTIDFKFDPAIFDNTKKVTFEVPTQITTRSEIEKPGGVFDANTTSGSKAQ